MALTFSPEISLHFRTNHSDPERETRLANYKDVQIASFERVLPFEEESFLERMHGYTSEYADGSV